MSFLGPLSFSVVILTITDRFSLVWLTVMGLFPLSLLLLKFNRGRLPREPRTPLSIVLIVLCLLLVVFAGNVALDPSTAGLVLPFFYCLFLPLSYRYFAAYLIGIVSLFTATQNKTQLIRWIYWIYDQYPRLHTWRLSRSWGTRLIQAVAKLKRQPVCILVKSDEVCAITISTTDGLLMSIADQPFTPHGPVCLGK